LTYNGTKEIFAMKWLLFLIAAFAMTAAAADVAGTWKASVETPNGTFESTFVFKVDAGKLTGTVTSAQMGESTISEGKVDGDDVTFAVVRDFNGTEFKITYKGKVSGSEMKLTIQVPNMDQAFEMTAKKQAS
jgi:hypothetical protein